MPSMIYNRRSLKPGFGIDIQPIQLFTNHSFSSVLSTFDDLQNLN